MSTLRSVAYVQKHNILFTFYQKKLKNLGYREGSKIKRCETKIKNQSMNKKEEQKSTRSSVFYIQKTIETTKFQNYKELFNGRKREDKEDFVLV